MIELPRNRPETRAFDWTLARQGAPICTTLGFPVRIICWDRHSYSDKDDIVGLVRRQISSPIEEVLQFDKHGKNSGGSGAIGDLAMAPVGTVEGKAVFTGDKVFGLLGKPVTIDFDTHSYAKGGDINGLKLKPPPIRFEGKRLTIDDKIWYRPQESMPWEYVACKDNWIEKFGQFETHFDYLKRNEGRPMGLECYTLSSPHTLDLEGTELKIGDVVWIKHNLGNGPNLITEQWLENFKKGICKVEQFTRIAPKRVELWQAKAIPPKAPEGFHVYVGNPYPTKDACDEMVEHNMPRGYKFVESAKVSEYYA